jgi:PmbA protein
MTHAFDGFDAHIVVETATTSKHVKFFRSEVDVVKEWRDHAATVYLYENERLLSMHIEHPTAHRYRQAAARARKVMRHLSPAPFHPGGATDYRSAARYDPQVLDDEAMVQEVERAIDTAPPQAGEVAGTLFCSVSEDTVSTSSGLSCTDRSSMAALSMRVLGPACSAHASCCSRRFAGIRNRIDETTWALVRKCQTVQSLKPATYDVILMPLAFGNLVSHVAEFSSAFAVDAGFSCFEGRLGERVADEGVTILDSGIEPDGLFSRKCDEEGVATRTTPLIENGVLATYLHNGTTAYRHDVASTGNAGVVSPQPWNTLVRSGTSTVDDLVSEVRDGVLVTNVWYTRFQNYRQGAFSTVVRDVALRICDGEVHHGVAGLRLHDTLPRLLKNTALLANDVQQVFWWEVEHPVFCPSALIRDVPITTAS